MRRIISHPAGEAMIVAALISMAHLAMKNESHAALREEGCGF
jgi:hypothetical protein